MTPVTIPLPSCSPAQLPGRSSVPLGGLQVCAGSRRDLLNVTFHLDSSTDFAGSLGAEILGEGEEKPELKQRAWGKVKPTPHP